MIRIASQSPGTPVWLLFLALGALSQLAFADLDAEAISEATGWKVLILEAKEGTAVVEDGAGATTFSLVATDSIVHDGETWDVGIIHFPDNEMSEQALLAVVSGGECSSHRSPVAVVHGESGKGFSTVLDDKVAKTLAVLDIDCGNFSGSGSELLIRARLTYCNDNESLIATGERNFIFGMPSLNRLFALDGPFVLHSPTIRDSSYQTPSFGTNEDGKPVLRYKGKVLTYNSPEAQRIVPPRGSGDIAEESTSGPRKLKGRLLDSEGRSIPDCPVQYGTRLTGMFEPKQSFEEDVVYTDENGYFEVPAGQGVEIVVDVPTYYRIRKLFYHPTYAEYFNSPADHPLTEEVTALQLQSRHAPIPVWKTEESIRKTFEAPSIHETFAIKLSSQDSPSVRAPKEDIDNADIVFTLQNPCRNRERRKADCEWSVEMRGQHGWQLQPADSQLMRFIVREAPEAGYKSSWKFDAHSLPRMFFIHNIDSNRYGILDGITLTESSENGLGQVQEVTIKCGYVVQSKNVGTRSLAFQR